MNDIFITLLTTVVTVGMHILYKYILTRQREKSRHKMTDKLQHENDPKKIEAIGKVIDGSFKKT